MSVQTLAVSPTTNSFEQLLEDIRKRRFEFTAQKHISQDIVARFVEQGVYRALVPRQLGGNEWSAHRFLEMVERIAQADGSAGWVASFGMAVTYLAALPIATIREIYRDSPDVIFAGGIYPPQPARRISNERIGTGYEVSGRWGFASGCKGATVVGVGIAPLDADDKPSLPRMAVMPRAQVRIEENWNVMGLIGTGSHDLMVDKVIVPEDWTFVRGAPANLDEPMFRYPSLSFATQALAVVGLGVARGAIEEVRALATRKASITGAPRVADRPQSQVDIAKCEAKLHAARAFFYESIDTAWDTLVQGDPLTDEQVSMLRLSSTHAARASAEVTREAFMMMGTTGIFEASPLAMQLRDAQVVTQHAFMGDVTYQNAGAMLFGLKPLPGYL